MVFNIKCKKTYDKFVVYNISDNELCNYQLIALIGLANNLMLHLCN